jgi:glycosyltransferase involved in cell wall biosynthesis
MKIYQVVPYYPPHIGGMEFYVEYLSNQLANKGNEVKVFTSSDRNYSYTENMNGVEVCRFKISAKFYNVPISNNLLSSLLRIEKPDILDAHQYPVYFSDMSSLASSLRKIPLFLHVHVVPDPKSVFSGFVLKSYYRFFERFTLKESQYVIAPSQVYKLMLARMGVNLERIEVIPYGVDLRRFNPSRDGGNFKKLFNLEGSRVILTVGRLNYQKGFHYLLAAMPKILLQVPNAKLVIVGEGELMKYLKDLSYSLGLRNNVVFTGVLPQSSISEAYASADVFVLPSLFESLGISLLEAQAMAKPVVGTRVGGLPEAMAEGKSGILVEPKKPKALAEAVVTLLRDQNLSKSMGINGRRFVEDRYDLEKSIDHVFKLYERAIKRS